MSLRVLSYNVHRYGDDHEALARVVRACAPHVAMLQEAPTWLGTRRTRQVMADSLGLRYVGWSSRNAILVAEGIELKELRRRRVWRPFFRRYPRPRMIATQLPGGTIGASLTVEGVDLALVVCHLGLQKRGRQHEIEQILTLCKSFGLPYLLAGDLNEVPDEPVWRRLAAEGLTDLGSDAGPTFNSSTPDRRIDAAQLSPQLTGRLLPIPAAPADLAAATDHLPLLIELKPGTPVR
ncbi:endonuclease/exonuclease/phosphatase family metal-dependent hydrolase [Kribbella aluminosa]|uniref:Endonuclease/exonuclease/phosphatase family metal-dependent hydrolase n=1 Tax=Kribbella aluminosa TaxID=416017 RepID=A0ABS4UZF0_9ACTN|nr:endonuclease/exonuclease/phosphatase family protein [Kribbella aluminosa]MBP2357028.1 endonuclease/exonuclease/phosphatase family metal-dependent hydrolase [Kribbella aluminosa]